MGVRIWAPSMPFFAEPSTRLSRVVPQDDCLSTSTSDMPYLAKNPFSAATNSGAASVRAIKPSLALVVSTSPAAAQALFWLPRLIPPNRAMPPAAAMDCLRKRRREASSALVVSSGVGLSVMAGFPLGEKKTMSRWPAEPVGVDIVVRFGLWCLCCDQACQGISESRARNFAEVRAGGCDSAVAPGISSSYAACSSTIKALA